MSKHPKIKKAERIMRQMDRERATEIAQLKPGLLVVPRENHYAGDRGTRYQVLEAGHTYPINRVLENGTVEIKVKVAHGKIWKNDRMEPRYYNETVILSFEQYHQNEDAGLPPAQIASKLVKELGRILAIAESLEVESK